MRVCNRLFLPLILCIISSLGCSIDSYFSDYSYGGSISKDPKLDLPIAIEVTDYGLAEGDGVHDWVYGLIPLMPCGFQVIESPETFIHGSERVQHDFFETVETAQEYEALGKSEEIEQETLDVALAELNEDYYPYDVGYEMSAVIAYDLSESNLFKEVCFLYGKDYLNPDEEIVFKYRPEVNILIDITEMTWNRYPTFYGLSMVGAAGWLVGFPVSFGSCRLVLMVEAVDVKHDETLWEKEYVAEVSCIEWIYYNWRASKTWVGALEDIMYRLRRDLKKNIPEFKDMMIEFEEELRGEEEEEDEGF